MRATFPAHLILLHLINLILLGEAQKAWSFCLKLGNKFATFLVNNSRTGVHPTLSYHLHYNKRQPLQLSRCKSKNERHSAYCTKTLISDVAETNAYFIMITPACMDDMATTGNE
jgi:hypothetical protein